ncbi:MAG: cytochrome c maturation protein CcmE [Coriobacteriales bacterium]|jgi:cytochrome c-type biogenesis protein CcmE|nr:cytochrome c maturation protein CcmE [Coriobacteriales bacterium]
MNAQLKKRLIIVTLIIVIVAATTFAYAGASGASKVVSVAEAASGSYNTQRVQVSGTVVDDSFTTTENELAFWIFDPANGSAAQVKIIYQGTAANTFGNGVEAICTGKLDEKGVLYATELVTKCPSKYETSTNALGVSQLLAYGESIVDKPVQVTGSVKVGSIPASRQGTVRFILVDADGSEELAIQTNEGLSEEITDGSTLVLTGTLGKDGVFTASSKDGKPGVAIAQ